MHPRKLSALRTDLHESLRHGQIDPAQLSPFQRVVLTTDGTLTELLEAYLFEKIHLLKLAERVVLTTQEIPALDLPVGREVIERKILLQGQLTKTNWLYAESIIVPDRLDEKFKEKLLQSQAPIGKLWLEYKVETFKEIIASTREPAKDLASYFQINRQDNLLGRTYVVFSNRQPIMMITEKFPESYFVQF